MRMRIINPPGAGLGLALENPLNGDNVDVLGGGRGWCCHRRLHQTPGLSLLGFNKRLFSIMAGEHPGLQGLSILLAPLPMGWERCWGRDKGKGMGGVGWW